MMQVMGNLLPMVLWGSIILLVVMVIRPILKKKSNRMMCMLWLLVTLRFLCPVAVKIPMPWLNVATSNMADAIPSVKSQEQVNNLQAAREDQSSELTESLNRTTPVNLEEFTDQKNRKSNEVFTDSAEAMNPGNPADQGNQEEKAEPADSVDSNEAMNSTDTVMMAKQVSPMNASDSAALVDRLETEDQMERTDVTDPGDRMTLDILKIFGGIWLLGTIIVLTAGLIKYWLIKRALCEAVYIAEWEKYPVRISDMSGVPLAFGIWNREIYVPVSFEKAGDGAENMFTQRQRELILWHETMHLKRRDPLRKVLAFVMVAVHWWNPLVWVCVKLMDRDIEMACDEAVLEQVGQKERNAYARTLLCFAEKQSGLTLITSFGESDAKSRIRNVLSYRKSSTWVKALMSLSVLFLGGCLTLNPTASAMEGHENLESGEAQTSDVATDTQITGMENAKFDMGHAAVPEYIKTSNTDLSYAKEYAKILDSYQEKYPEENLCCNLIYFNNDEIPDLWIESVYANGTDILGLYMYENGNVYSLMKEERADLKFYQYYKKKGMLYIRNDMDDEDGDGLWDGEIETYLLMNSEKKFDRVSVKKKRLRELRDDPNYTSGQIFEEEKKNGEWEYNGNKISMEEAEKLLKARAGSDDYEHRNYINGLGLEKIKKDLTKLATGDNLVGDSYTLTNSLYEKFKQGKEKVYFDPTELSSYWFVDEYCHSGGEVPSGKEYTITELMDVFREGYLYGGMYDYRAQFSYIDCGQDGVPELAVEIQGISLVAWNDETDLLLVIKEKEGKLQCTFAEESGGRWKGAINEAGVYAGVSEGGCYQIGKIGMLDANAEYHEIISCYKEFGCGHLMYDDYSEEDNIALSKCTFTIDGKDYTYYVEGDTGEEILYSTIVRMDPFCMRREDVVRLEDEALEKHGCTKEFLEADDILFFEGDLQEIIDEFRNLES